jgi:hopanoid biosynthesis associated RND transporter like protein HpnN
VTEHSPNTFWPSLARGIARRPLAVAALGALVCVLAGGVAAKNLKMKTSRIELTGAEVPFAKRHLELEDEFGDLNRLVVALHGDPAMVRLAAEALVARVREDSQHFRSVFHRVSPAELGPHALLFVPPAQMKEAEATLERVLPELRRGALAGAVGGLATELQARLDAGPTPNEDSQEGSQEGGLLLDWATRLLGDTQRTLGGDAVSETPLDRISGLDEAGYAWGADGRTLIVLVAFREEVGALDSRTTSVKALRRIVKELAAAHIHVDFGLTGKPVLEVDEMATYEADSLRASLFALVAVTLLLVFALRRLTGPLLVGGCLILAVALTLGLASVWPGHLNLMAVVFVMVVIGLGVDFGIHLVGRYDEARAGGADSTSALVTALSRVGPAVAAGGATTAGAFFGALLTEFKGLREFGVVAGLGVFACMAVMLTILPALVVLVDRGSHRGVGGSWLGFLDRWTQQHPKAVLGVVAGLSLGALSLLPSLRYDADLLKMQDPNLDSVKLELQLLEDARLTSWFLAYSTKDPAQLAAVASSVMTLPGVKRVESALSVLPADADARLPRARRVQRRLRAVVGEGLPASDAAGLRASLERLVDVIDDALEQAVANDIGEAITVLEDLGSAAEAARDALPPQGLPPATLDYDRRLANALGRRLTPVIQGELASSNPKDLPPALRDRFIGPQGSYLLRIYPRGNLWHPDELHAFLSEVRTVLPEVSGVPVLLHDSSALMLRSYQRAGWVALGVISLCLVLLFRSLGPTLLTLLTLLIGALWTAGLMAALGVELNPANLVALPLLLGIGVDTAVHVVHRARDLAPGEPLAGTSLGHALVFSGLTSAASFGSLLLADHPGTASIGAAIALGVLCCVGAGLTIPAAVLAARRL